MGMISLLVFIILVALVVAAVLGRINWLAALIAAIAVVVIWYVVTGRIDGNDLDSVVRIATLRM